MFKDAIEKIIELAVPNIEEVNGRFYSDKKLHSINKELRATSITMNTLSGLVSYIKDMKSDFKNIPHIVQIVSPTKVRLITGLDKDREREVLVEVNAEVPEFEFGKFVENEKFIIGVQSKFLDTDAENNDKPIILKFAGNVKSGTVAEYGDTGVGQKATIKSGVASLQEVEVPSPCYLKPYRTFVEVNQPMSSFIFRVKDEKNYGVHFALFDADGGAWRKEAKDNIKKFLTDELQGIDNITVIS